MRLFGGDLYYSHENVFYYREFCKDKIRFLLACGQKNDNFELSLEGLVQNVILAQNVRRKPNNYELCKYEVGINLNEQQPQILSLWGHCKCRLKNAGIPPYNTYFYQNKI